MPREIAIDCTRQAIGEVFRQLRADDERITPVLERSHGLGLIAEGLRGDGHDIKAHFASDPSGDAVIEWQEDHVAAVRRLAYRTGSACFRA